MYTVCATSCPVGIACIYMTVVNLERAVKTRGYEVKVETQGVQGAENETTAEDIGCTDGCIIASDVRIKNSGRLEPVPTLTAGVSEVVKDAKAIVEESLEAIS